LLAAGFVFFILPGQTDARLNNVRGAKSPVSKRARALHQQLFVADLHADSLLFGRDLRKRWERGHVDFPRMREGNVALQAFTVVTKAPKGQNIERNPADSDQITRLVLAQRWPPRTWSSLLERAIYQAGRLNEFAASEGQRFVLVRNREELDYLVAARAANHKVVGGWLGIEGAHALEGDVENLDRLYDAGFRMIGLAHFFDNEFAGSAHGMEKYGLPDKGRELVQRMEAKHMIIDLAHTSPKTIDDVLKIAKRPVLVSHTGVKGTCDNQRNLSDAQLRAISANGGLIGIGYWVTAVCGSEAPAIARAIRHAANIAGVEHVALGSDFDGAVSTPFDASGLDQITQALLDTGFSEADVRKIMGENVLRFLGENLPQ